mmetsp:Transcript_14970/g.32911  ORF Transcript_14970/g.32911 Transcript_14970/m.32911 type:complete len:887 (+) Transcript_14970:72-2732(+)|eukprot:CAMPEP_0170599432 /NCGR_PEP_ID=MMETSP0224-20130122/16792_1 /TAXON_ID=285029 /ORGANISM="Togula jolla, Strain CCCM 725" /LENGTH=886 /DNA_ID=CAMNT_0010924079 /DNA_START=61 /DNA_END=2721 /DNA_ORIENTATION=-
MAILSLVTLALLIGHGASLEGPGQCPSLVLLQLNAQKLQKTKAATPELETGNRSSSLPGIDALLSSSSGVVDDISQKVAELREKIMAAQEQSLSMLRAKHAQYEANLTSLSVKIHSAELENEAIRDATAETKRSNHALVDRARNLTDDNHALRADLQQLRLNLSTAHEFIERALEGADDSKVEQLKVLRELEERHAASSATREQQRRMEEIAGAGGFSLLAVSSAADPHAGPEAAVGTLESSLAKLREEQSAGEDMLDAEFQEEYRKASERLGALLNEQSKLKSKQSTALSLHEDLQKAVIHLERVQATLFNQAKQLRLFSGSVGQRPLPGAPQAGSQAPAFLQVSSELDATATKTLPEDLNKPNEVFEAMHSQVNALGAQLEELHRQHEATVARRLAEYEARLQAQEEENSAIAAKNAALSEEIARSQSTCSDLRVQATAIQSNNEELRRGLDRLRVNMSTAMDFVRDALDTLNVSKAPELQVLRTLRMQDRAHETSQQHAQRLKEIATVTLETLETPESLLQISLTPNEGSSPKALITSVGKHLDVLGNEMSASEKAMEVSFEERFKAGNATRDSLLERQQDLNSTLRSQLQLQHRLESALEHLVQTQTELETRTRALRLFAVKIGSGVTAEAQTEASEAEAAAEAALAEEEAPAKAPAQHLSWAARIAEAFRRAIGRGGHHSQDTAAEAAEDVNDEDAAVAEDNLTEAEREAETEAATEEEPESEAEPASAPVADGLPTPEANVSENLMAVDKFSANASIAEASANVTEAAGYSLARSEQRNKRKSEREARSTRALRKISKNSNGTEEEFAKAIASTPTYKVLAHDQWKAELRPSGANQTAVVGGQALYSGNASNVTAKAPLSNATAGQVQVKQAAVAANKTA